MIKIEFSQDEINQLRHDRYYYPEPRVLCSIDVLLLKSQGIAHNKITEIVGICPNTLRDNARYQKCRLVQELALSLNIELLYIPPYSPNLNLIERLWKFSAAIFVCKKKMSLFSVLL